MSAKRKHGGSGAPASERAPRRRKSRRRSKAPAVETASSDVDGEAAELGIGSRVIPPPQEHDEAPGSETPAAERMLDPADVQEEIRALEARLDGMIRRASERASEAPAPASLRDQVGTAARDVADRLGLPGGGEAARELFSSDYFLRQWGRLSLRNRSEEVDDFGLDPTYEKRIEPILDFLYKHYFRVSTAGIENIPASGRCLVVANHSGTLPIDGVMLRSAVRIEHPSVRELRWLAEDFIFYLPFAGAFFNRIGAVRACQENAERLLKKGNLVAVFPEGIKGIRKLYKDRYNLQRFGRGGFIRLCLRTQTPLVPCAVIGAEETNPMLYRIEYLSKALGLPYVPVTPTFPLLGPLGMLPAPSKWIISFGEPLRFEGYGPEAADDHVLVGRLSERVRSAIQAMLDRGLKDRRSVWFG
jgi:1-acyl-sn-glycerol-3-phosphate acyltransferase